MFHVTLPSKLCRRVPKAAEGRGPGQQPSRYRLSPEALVGPGWGGGEAEGGVTVTPPLLAPLFKLYVSVSQLYVLGAGLRAPGAWRRPGAGRGGGGARGDGPRRGQDG